MKLEGGAAQDRVHGRVNPVELPVGRQPLADRHIQQALLGHHATHDLREEGLVRIGEPLAFHVAAETMLGELAYHSLHADARHLHLVEGLHGGQPGDRAGLAIGAAEG